MPINCIHDDHTHRNTNVKRKIDVHFMSGIATPTHTSHPSLHTATHTNTKQNNLHKKKKKNSTRTVYHQQTHQTEEKNAAACIAFGIDLVCMRRTWRI